MERRDQADPLVILVDLEKRVRSVLTWEELQFVFVNETHSLIPYRQAILFSSNNVPLAFSGVAAAEANAPFIQWLKKNLSPLIRETADASRLSPTSLSSSAASDWSSWLPQFVFLQPLVTPKGERLGCLLLARDNEWTDDDLEILDILAGTYGHAWDAITLPRNDWSLRRNWSWSGIRGMYKIVGLILLIGLLALPVHLTVLAPAEIVAISPATIRAPVEGVVETIFVKPNQEVNVGDILFSMDAASQRSELAVAKKIFASLKAEYTQVSRLALSDPRSKRQLTKISGRIKEQNTRVQYLLTLIARMKVLSPIRGSVIIDNPSSWEGRPVALGEKIMGLANQDQVEVEAWLSIADAIDLPPGSPIRLYLNSDPLKPVDAVLHTFSYEAQPYLGNSYAHRIRGAIQGNKQRPRLGLRGTARLEGESVWLVYWIFRRPIAALRQFFGI